MDVSILDFPGVFLGPALGLLELGHRVRYFIPGNPLHGGTAGIGNEKILLLERAFGRGERTPVYDADLVVYVDSFSDGAGALETGSQLWAPLHPEDPLADSINPLQLELRLVSLAPVLMQLDQLVVVDMSDLASPEHHAFAALPGVKLRRERKKGSVDRSRAFPFLYHSTLLAVELTADRNDWFLPRGRRARVDDLYFAGSVDHPRYGGRRRAHLERIRENSGLRVRVDSDATYQKVLSRLQSCTAGIYLAGTGDLCFRAHELLALGVPGYTAEPFTIETAPGFERAFSAEFPPRITHEEVVQIYQQCYTPRRAAETLLAEVYSPASIR